MNATLTPRRAAAFVAAALLIAAALPAAAQMGGMGGRGGGGHGGGGRGGPGNAAPSAQEQPTLDDLMAPDPWRIWLEKLQLDSPRLALTPQQQPLFDGFVRELDLASQANAQRVARAVRRRPSSVSAQVDVGRDLRQQSDDAKDWQSAVDDLRQRWEALRAVLSSEQQALVDAAYRASRETPMRTADGRKQKANP